jgi:hypothetical protein
MFRVSIQANALPRMPTALQDAGALPEEPARFLGFGAGSWTLPEGWGIV